MEDLRDFKLHAALTWGSCNPSQSADPCLMSCQVSAACPVTCTAVALAACCLKTGMFAASLQLNSIQPRHLLALEMPLCHVMTNHTGAI